MASSITEEAEVVDLAVKSNSVPPAPVLFTLIYAIILYLLGSLLQNMLQHADDTVCLAVSKGSVDPRDGWH